MLRTSKRTQRAQATSWIRLDTEIVDTFPLK